MSSTPTASEFAFFPSEKSRSMIDDPIVEEIHKVREKLWEECGGSLDKLMDRLRAREEEDRSRLVRDISEIRQGSDDTAGRAFR